MENMVCVQQHWKKKNVKRENLNRTNTKSPSDIKTESLKARSPPDSRGGGCSRQGWITDTKVSTGSECGSYWSSCMWLLGCWIWLCDGSYWLGKTSSGEQQPWQQLQMSILHMYDPWHLSATQSIIHQLWQLSAISFAAPLPPSIHRFSFDSISLSCFLSSSARTVFLCSPSMPPLPLHYPSPSHFSVSLVFPSSDYGTDSGFSKTAEWFYIMEALHLTADAEAGLNHPQREREKLVFKSHNCEVRHSFGSTWGWGA